MDKTVWVVCCGMLRSGSTLHYNIAAELVERAGIGCRVGILEGDSLTMLLKERPYRNQTVVVKMHNYTPQVDDLLAIGEMRHLYTYRDLRDVLVSWMEMQSLSFEQTNPQIFLKGCVDAFSTWTQRPNTLCSRYEDILVADLAGEVRRIAAHLDIVVDEREVSAIASKCGLDGQRKHIADFRFQEHGLPVMNTRYDPTTLLHNRHLNDAAIGKWRQRLTAEQQEQILIWFGDWLTQQGYQ